MFTQKNQLTAIFVMIFLSCALLLMVGCEPDPVDPTPRFYTLTMQIEGQGSVTPSMGSHSYEEGTIVDLTATPADGYEFKEWIGDVADTGSANTTVVMDKDKTVRVLFEKEEEPSVEFTLTMEIEGQGSVTPDVGSHSYEEGTVVDLTATPAEGYEFKEWIGDVADTGSANTTVVMDKNKTVEAVFVKEDDPVPTLYTLTIEIEGQGEVKVEEEELFISKLSEEYSFEEGTILLLTAIPSEGWEFEKWIGDVEDTGGSTTALIIDEDKTVKAVFEEKDDPVPILYTLAIKIEGQGSVTPDVGSHSYEEGTVVDLTATPAAGHEFKEWIGDVADTGSASTTVFMDEDKEIKALFEEKEDTPLEITEVEELDAISVPLRTAFEDLELPDSIEVTLNDHSTINVGVEWDSAPYNGDVAGDYSLDGDLINLPDNVTNPNNYKAKIMITVEAKAESVLTTIKVHPDQAFLHVGDTQTFTATGYDQYENTMALTEPPVWAVTEGIGTLAPEEDEDITFNATEEGRGEVIATVGEGDEAVSGSAEIMVFGEMVTKTGEITGEETWSGWIELTGDIVIKSGGKLTIEPGTRVTSRNFDDQFGGIDTSLIEIIIEEGDFIAEGTESNPIVFTSGASDPKPGDWYGLRFMDTYGNSTLELKHFVIEYGLNGLSVENNSVAIENGMISRNSGRGVNVEEDAVFKGINLTITHNGNRGIDAFMAEVDIADSMISNNQSTGLRARGINAKAIVTNSNIINNKGRGIDLSHTTWHSLDGGTAIIKESTISNNDDDGINAWNGIVKVDRTTISDNGSHGIDNLDNRSRLIFASVNNSIITNNDGYGIRLSNGIGDDGIGGNIISGNQIGIYIMNRLSETLHLSGSHAGTDLPADNDIFDNIDYEVYNDSSEAIIANGNFWGEPTTTELNASADNLTKIYDSRNDPNVGIVGIINWSDTPFH